MTNMSINKSIGIPKEKRALSSQGEVLKDMLIRPATFKDVKNSTLYIRKLRNLDKKRK